MLVLCAAAALVAPAQTVTTVVTFDGTDGDGATGQLSRGTDGNFYGVSAVGGVNLYHGIWGGTIFKIAPGGALTTLHNFCSESGCTDGQDPLAGLVQATDGNFYGTTSNGGVNDGGTIFRITLNGRFTTLYRFCAQSACPDGANPQAGLVQSLNGDLYGTTAGGGAPCSDTNGCGTVFKITPGGTLSTLYRFCAQSACPEGANPLGPLIQATDGNFYGTTSNRYDGAIRTGGSVFKITPGGALTRLYSFCSQSGCRDGATPRTMVQAPDGNFYGITAFGGGYRGGTVFKITPSGALTTLYRFCALSGCADGSNPDGEVVVGIDGNLYGTTYVGGTRRVARPSRSAWAAR